MIVRASFENPLNMIIINVKNIEPKKIQSSAIVFRGITVLRNNVIIKARRISCTWKKNNELQKFV